MNRYRAFVRYIDAPGVEASGFLYATARNRGEALSKFRASLARPIIVLGTPQFIGETL